MRVTNRLPNPAGVSFICSMARQREKPVRASTKYGLAINFKAAKTLGLEVPPTVLARADEVIE